MSEYQYYEFQAIDRPLTQPEMAELRALSTRATITSTRFVNVYHYGDFRGDPAALMEQYFDAFLYVANWGTHECMLRLPRRLLDLETAALYCPGEGASARATDEHVILEFRSDEEGGDWEEGEAWLSSLIPVRAEIAAGDLRGLYLGWLLCAQNEVLDDEEREPPVPPGLGTLSASLKAFAEFLRLDGDLLAVAAERSAGAAERSPSADELERWIRHLPDADKDDLLLRLVQGGNPHLRAEILQRFERTRASASSSSETADDGRRTVAEILSAAAERAETRRRQETERKAQARARRQREEAAARTMYLDGLTGREEEIWKRVDTLVETKRPTDYDEAVRLLTDLRDLGARSGQTAPFAARLDRLREQHARKVSLLSRLDRAGLGTRTTGAAAGTP